MNVEKKQIKQSGPKAQLYNHEVAKLLNV